MRLVGLAVAALVILFGIRLILIALKTAFSREILVREGIRTRWQPIAPEQAWKRAFRDGVMGLLLVVLGVVMII